MFFAKLKMHKTDINLILFHSKESNAAKSETVVMYALGTLTQPLPDHLHDPIFITCELLCNTLIVL